MYTIDEIVPPGTTINPADNSWANPARWQRNGGTSSLPWWPYRVVSLLLGWSDRISASCDFSDGLVPDELWALVPRVVEGLSRLPSRRGRPVSHGSREGR
jgi:hypothetical protein